MISEGNITLNISFNKLDIYSQIILILSKMKLYNEFISRDTNLASDECHELIFYKSNDGNYIPYNCYKNINLNSENHKIKINLHRTNSLNVYIEDNVSKLNKNTFDLINIISNEVECAYSCRFELSRKLIGNNPDKSIENIVSDIKLFENYEKEYFKFINFLTMDDYSHKSFMLNKHLSVIDNIRKLNMSYNDIITKRNDKYNMFISLLKIILNIDKEKKRSKDIEVINGMFGIHKGNLNRIAISLDGYTMYSITKSDSNHLDQLFNPYINAFINLLDIDKQYNSFISKLELSILE